MASNLTIESPNFDKISKEAGQFTADAINLLWAALNDTRASLRRDFRQATEKVAPKVKTLSPAASVDNLDSEGASTVSFTGGTQNFTGIRAPETGESRVVFIQNSGTGTITIKNNATSENANRFLTATAADLALDQHAGAVFQYLESRWREVARSG
jgi:hypothetical protein